MLVVDSISNIRHAAVSWELLCTRAC